MQKINVEAFYRFGAGMKEALLRPLMRPAPLEADIQGEWEYSYSIEQIIHNIDYCCAVFLEKTEGYDLPKAREIAANLIEIGIKCHKEVQAAQDENEKKFIFRNLLHQCKEQVSQFENALAYEISVINAYVLPEKGLYSLDKLITKGEAEYSPETLRGMPDLAIYDMREAAKCLAFDCPTAMAFHLCRALEAVVLSLWETIIGHEWEIDFPKKRDRNLGKYIEELERLNMPLNIITRLREIKDDRNGLMHPDMKIELKEALPVFKLVSAVIPFMTDEIITLRS